MRKYTYIDKTTGKRIYSDVPLKSTGLELVQEVRGSIPRGMEKNVDGRYPQGAKNK